MSADPISPKVLIHYAIYVYHPADLGSFSLDYQDSNNLAL